MTRIECTVLAIGAWSCCQPCALALKEPPTVNELLDCMTRSDRPLLSRNGMTSAHRLPPRTRNVPSAVSDIPLNVVMSITTPFGAIVCPPIECRAPAIATFTFSCAARRSNAASCASAPAESASTRTKAATGVRLRRLASSVKPAGIGVSRGALTIADRAMWYAGRPTKTAARPMSPSASHNRQVGRRSTTRGGVLSILQRAGPTC
jgi:hypothetical protein